MDLDWHHPHLVIVAALGAVTSVAAYVTGYTLGVVFSRRYLRRFA